ELTGNRLDITLKFSKNVVPVFGKNITVRQVSNNALVGNVNVRTGSPAASTSFSYTVSGLSPNTDYYVTVDEGSFVNASGVNAGTEIYRGITDATTWRFKTKAAVDTQAPTLVRN